MKKLYSLFFSMKFSGILLLVFAGTMAMATFIENDLGTQAAKIFVYESIWFELLLLILAISMTGIIFKNKLLKQKKYFAFIFHISFVIILAGSSITRYIGYEGTMTIREGEKSNEIISENTYIIVHINNDGEKYYFEFEKLFSQYKRNSFYEELNFGDENCTLAFAKFFKNAVVLNLEYKGKTREITLFGGKNFLTKGVKTKIKDTEFNIKYGSKLIKIPFSLYLRDFQLERYPGSMSPSSFASEVTLIDNEVNLKEDRRIYMNNVLNYKGYRFFQSSYDKDEKGTVLSVNHDYWGTFVTYIGYFLMALGMFLSFFNKNSRFRRLMRKSSGNTTLISILIGFSVFGLLIPQNIMAENEMPDADINSSNYISAEHAAEFGKLLVLNQKGRMVPINTLSSEIVRKVIKKTKFMGLNSDQVFLGMISDPLKWQKIPLIKVADNEIKKILGINSNYASFNDFIDHENMKAYKLNKLINEIINKKPSLRNEFDKKLIKVDERLNICYKVYKGDFLNIFPNNKTNTLLNSSDLNKFDTSDVVFVKNILRLYYNSIQKGIKTGSWDKADENLSYIKIFQKRYGKEFLPPSSKVNLEILYNKWNIFKRLFSYYSLIGFVMLILLLINLFSSKNKFKTIINIVTGLIIIGFLFHSFGLIVRWIISGHAPWSDAYETMIYIAWATVLAGIFFIKKSKITLALTVILASLTLMVANLNWMDPEITNLVPVLKSYWLIIHVALITASYSFLAIGALIGFLNLILMILKNKQNHIRLNNAINKLSDIVEINLIIGLIMLTIGTFLGAIWANESWGRYWGWDPKETWALISVIIYAFVTHMRLIKGMKDTFSFNLASLLSFASILMTYFGVNFYLSGMHSYAQGDAVPIPVFIYYTMVTIGIVLILAYWKERKYSK